MNTETNNPSSGYELTKEVASLFESLKHVNEDGVEYWSARELYPYLGYARWQRFEEIIEKAKEACKSVFQRIEDHFTDVGKIVKAGVATKPKADVYLTRYACYLVAQNGDSRKTEIAQAQTYFAIQTRYAEIQQMEAYQALTSEEKIRKENIRGKAKANNAHYEVGKEVRAAIQRIGGTMPEDLPPAEDIKKLERRVATEKKIESIPFLSASSDEPRPKSQRTHSEPSIALLGFV